MAVEGQKEADRTRMKTLLVEAIATLCRNGLQYEEDLSVEGLIGITVDKRDVFLVSVKETFSLKPEPEVKSDEEISEETETQSSRRGSKRSAGDHDSGSVGHAKRRPPHRQYSGHHYDDSSGHAGFDPPNEDSDIGQHTRVEADDDEDDDIIFVDPNLEIKKEINKNDDEDNPCMYETDQNINQRIGPPHQRRSDMYDPRTSHPSGLDSEQLAATYSSSVKQEHSSETVTMSGANQSPSTSTGAQPLEGFSDMQAYPVEWSNQSGQDFMSGDDSLQQSPSHQASGSGGASQQVRLDFRKIESRMNDSGRTEYKCPVCDLSYTKKINVMRHYNTEHLGLRYACPVCYKEYRYPWDLRGHLKKAHSTDTCQ